jgi:hypothetical protein
MSHRPWNRERNIHHAIASSDGKMDVRKEPARERFAFEATAKEGGFR